MEQLIHWWTADRIQPTIHDRLPLEQFRAAMAQVKGREAIGRVLLAL